MPDSSTPLPSGEAGLACCLTTTSNQVDAEKIAQSLLDQSLAACVQIDGPIQSHYCWQGKSHCDDEYRLMIKTTIAVWPRLRQHLESIHPYDEPEIILVPVTDASEGYRHWVMSQVGSPE